MNFIDRIAGCCGYVRKESVMQSSIAFKGDDRAHVVLQFGDYHLVGEVDCFRTTTPGASL